MVVAANMVDLVGVGLEDISVEVKSAARVDAGDLMEVKVGYGSIVICSLP